MLFLKAVDKICQQGSFQYENFFNYVTSILFCNQLDKHDTVETDKVVFTGTNDKPNCVVMSRMLVSMSSFVYSDIDMLEEFAYLRTPEGGRIQLELLPNQGMLIK